MFGELFYHRSIRKVVVGFGTLFNEVMLVRYDENNVETSRMKVPLAYAPKQKYLVRTVSDLPNDKQVAVIYPRLSFYITSIRRNMDRHLVSTNVNYAAKDDEDFYKQYNPVPYDINLDLYVIGKNSDDVLQIVERILPYFLPQYTLTMNSIPTLDLKDDVPIILNGMPFDDSFDGKFDDKRSIVWTFQFTAKTNFYGRILEQGMIKKIQTDFLIPEGFITEESMADAARSARVVTEVDPNEAGPEDDYEIKRTITEYEDGKKFNPVTLEDEPVE